MKVPYYRVVILLLLFSFAVCSCGNEEEIVPLDAQDILEVLEATGEHTVLVAILKETRLDAVLSREDRTFTLFAPTDAAFAPRDADEVLSFFSITYLNRLIRYHAFEPNLSPGRLQQTQEPLTLLGQPITVQRENNRWLANAVVFTTEDALNAANATIYPIDSIIKLPDFAPTIEPQYIGDILDEEADYIRFNQLTGITDLQQALRDSTQQFTVFVFTDEAFQAFVQTKGIATADSLPYYIQKNFSQYHIVPDTALSLTTLRNIEELPTLLGKPLKVFNEGDAVFLQSPVSNVTIRVLGEPQVLRNGNLYAIESPLDVPITAKNLIEDEFDFNWMKESLAGTPTWDSLDNLHQEYTLVIPNNAQVDAFLGLSGSSIISEIGKAQAEAFAKYHIIKGLANVNNGREWGAFPTLLENPEARETTFSILLTTNGLVNGEIRQETVDRYHRFYIANGQFLQSQVLQPVTVSQLISFHPEMNTLEEVISTINFQNSIRGNDYTLLAPSDAGFTTALANTTNGLDSLQQVDADLLFYHMLSKLRSSNTFVTGENVPTFRVDAPLRVSTTEGLIFFGERSTARVVGNPFVARNGIVYLIDNVLLP